MRKVSCGRRPVNCNDVDLALVDWPVASRLPPQAEEHLRSCVRCQQLLLAFSTPVPGEPPSPTILRQIEQGMLADLHAVRRLAPKRYFFAAFAAVFVSIAAVGVYRLGAFAIAVMSPLQAGGILSALVIGGALLAYSLVHQMVPGSRYRIPPKLLSAAVIISLTVAMAVLFQFQHERNFWANGWACLRAGIPIGILAAVPFWLLLRRGAVLSPGVTGAATGLLAGLVGTTVLEIHCPNLDAWHILVSHLGVSVLLAIAGFAAGWAAEIANARSFGRQRK
jgi:hypothetical protein